MRHSIPGSARPIPGSARRLRQLAGALLLSSLWLAGPAVSQQLIYTYENTTSGTIAGNSSGLNVNGAPGTNCTASNPNALVRTFTVSESFTVDTVAVGLNVSHPTRDELAFVLESPGGIVRSILNDGATNGSGDPQDNYDVMVSEFAEVNQRDNDYDDLDEPFYHRDVVDPTDDNLGDFSGVSSAGTWTLYSCDENNDAQTGTFNRARLVLIESTTATTVCTSTTGYEWGDNGDGNSFTSTTFGDITLTEASTSDVYSNGLADSNFLTLTGPQGGHTGFYGLGMTVEPGDDPLDTEVDESGAQIVTFTFSPPARDLSFDLLDIDQGGFEDVVRIRALDASGISQPVEATPVNTTEIFGDLFSGDSTVAPTDTDGNVAIFIAGPVETMTLEFQSGSAPNDPGDQFIGITDFSLCAWDFDDAPDSYGTDLGTGARHALGDRDIFLGTAAPDGEDDGQPVAAGTDNSGANGDGTEDDGVSSFPSASTLEGVYTTTVTVTNNSGSSANLCGWIDFSQDGTYEADEGSCVTVPASGDNGACTETSPGVFSCTVSWTVPVADRGNSGNFYSRFRVTTDSMTTSEPTGAKTDGEVEGYRVSISTLPITLAYFESTVESPRRTTVHFVTATETSNIGFELLGLQDGTWHPAATVPSRVIDSATPTAYTVTLPWAPEAFLLVDLDARGGERAHGPFSAGTSVGALPQPKAVDWTKVATEARAASLDSASSARVRWKSGLDLDGDTRSGDESEDSSDSGGGLEGGGGIDSSETVLLHVSTPGIQRVTHADLLAAGVDWSGAALGALAVFDAGEPLTRYVECPGADQGLGTWGPGCVLELVADVETTLATDENVLELRLDRDGARPAATLEASAGLHRTASVTRRLEVAEQSQYSFASPTGDPWFDGRLLSFGSAVSLERSLEAADVGRGPATLELVVWGGTDLPTTPDHHVRVLLDGVEIGDLRFDGIVEERATLDVGGLLTGLEQTLELELPGDIDGPFDLVHLEGFTVTYPGRTVAREGRFSTSDLVGTPRDDAYAIAGFESPDVLLWLRDGRRWLRASVEARPGLGDDRGTLAVDVPPGASHVEAAERQRASRPRVEAFAPRPLFSVDAEAVLLAPPVFADRLDELVALQERRGFAVDVATTDSIFAAYSDHAPAPEAIHAFLEASNRRTPLRSVLLVGGDTYDPLDHLGLGSISHVPTIYTALGELVRFAPSDELLVDFDGDAVPDVPIGRLPARTLAELETMIAKTVARGEIAETTRALLVSGRSDPAADLSRLNQEMALGLGTGWSVELASSDRAELEVVRAQIQASFAGADLISYLGHSAYAQWDFTPLLTTTDVPSLPAGPVQPVVAQWGCWNGYFVSPEVETLSSTLLAEPGRGASVALGSTSLTSPASHRELARRFFDAVSHGATTVGEALLQAKRELAAVGGYDDAVLGIVLLGDPATPIGAPAGPSPRAGTPPADTPTPFVPVPER